MDNHYHLIIETFDGNLLKGMRQLNGVYTQASNGRHGHSGHLSQGRYKVILMDKDRYLLEFFRYEGKDDLNIPKQQKRPIAKPLSEIAAQHKDRKTAIIAAYETGATAGEKMESFINCTLRR